MGSPHYLDSLNEAEVAAELGIAHSAVKSRLHKGRRSLSGRLQQEREGPVAQTSSVDVDVVDVRREPNFVPGTARAHVVVLHERGGPRALPIFIGEAEGRAMASSPYRCGLGHNCWRQHRKAIQSPTLVRFEPGRTTL